MNLKLEMDGGVNKNALLASASSTGVSDDEALRALQREASEREKEEQNVKNQRYKRRNQDANENPSKQRKNRWETNVEYYGPDRSTNHNKEEQDNNNNNNNPEKKELANFGLSGALTETKAKNKEKLIYQEPPEARIPNTQWRLYVFKGERVVETLHISKRSAYYIGRNADLCHIVIAHESCSSQHAVLQYRSMVSATNGGTSVCSPYLMDLESTNGTFLNGVQLDSARYYQLKKGDVVKFGASTREYVLLTANTTSI